MKKNISKANNSIIVQLEPMLKTKIGLNHPPTALK